jgi:hypothetical protein
MSNWRKALIVLWPSFMMAAVLEALVFGWVDPADLQPRVAMSRMAVYTLAFFAFWAVTAAASAVSVWLWSDAPVGAPEGG